MNKNRIILLYGILVVFVACQRQESGSAPAATAAGSAPTSTETQAPVDGTTVAVDTRIPVTPPTFLDRCALGTSLGGDGNVQESKEVFASGEPIYLSMWIRESPGGLSLTAQWFDKDEQMVADERRPMNGGMVATFKLAPKTRLPAGDYTVKGWWGGNEACAYKFRVEGPPPAKKKASGKKKT